MKEKKVLVTKELLRCDSLPVYGNSYWNTPNIDALALQGTIFRHHFTTAPSTAMAVTCMFSGLHAHELERRYYTEVESFSQTTTLFDDFESIGYQCHVVWTKADCKATYRYTKCYGENTILHNTENSFDELLKEVRGIKDSRFFLWLHLPTVLGNSRSLGGDVEELDRFMGHLRELFPDECIFLSSDHGHMNLEKGIPVYGFHVYNGSIRVPLIAPRIRDLKEVSYPTSHMQIRELIWEEKLIPKQYVFSDTQYYLQPNRKLAIIKGRYKYIYNKYYHSEELYDYLWDPKEEANLLDLLANKTIIEPYRQRKYPIWHVYFYPYLDDAAAVYSELQNVMKTVWRQGKFHQEFPRRIKTVIKRLSYRLKKPLLRNTIKTNYS